MAQQAMQCLARKPSCNTWTGEGGSPPHPPHPRQPCSSAYAFPMNGICRPSDKVDPQVIACIGAGARAQLLLSLSSSDFDWGSHPTVQATGTKPCLCPGGNSAPFCFHDSPSESQLWCLQGRGGERLGFPLPPFPCCDPPFPFPEWGLCLFPPLRSCLRPGSTVSHSSPSTPPGRRSTASEG